MCDFEKNGVLPQLKRAICEGDVGKITHILSHIEKLERSTNK